MSRIGYGNRLKTEKITVRFKLTFKKKYKNDRVLVVIRCAFLSKNFVKQFKKRGGLSRWFKTNCFNDSQR
jgi:hypothetical protein